MTSLASRLQLPEAVGLSMSVVAPTVTAAFNITLVVQATGPAAPLTFAIGMVAMGLIALSFMAFSRRVAHAGSAYAYIAQTFGNRIGFAAGWTMLLTYVGFATGFAALVGSFACAVLQTAGIATGSLWIVIGCASMVIAWWLTYRDMRVAGRLMLILEAAAIVGITVLCFDILRQVHPSSEEVLSTWKPSTEFGGWTGLGFGMVFSFLCFAGFEGAACLGEETQQPRRNIPIALFGTLIFSGLFFAFVAYCEVVGFGPRGIHDLAKASTPLNDLALRYASPRLAIALDLAAAVSCFSGVIGGLAAAGRILFALGRAGLSPALGEVHPVHRQPCAAVSVAAIMIIVPFVLWAPFAGASGFYSATSTIGVLALILIYIGVGVAEAVETWGSRPLWAMLCVCGPVLLLWVLYRNLYPIPEYPNNLWPYVALAWLASSALIIRSRPAVGESRAVTAG